MQKRKWNRIHGYALLGHLEVDYAEQEQEVTTRVAYGFDLVMPITSVK